MSSDYRVALTPEAARNLDDIYNYVCDDLKNPKAAENIIDEISDLLISLENMPRRYPVSDVSKQIGKSYRKCGVKNYVAFYRIDEINKIVIVSKVYYAKRDFDNLDFFKFFDD